MDKKKVLTDEQRKDIDNRLEEILDKEFTFTGAELLGIMEILTLQSASEHEEGFNFVHAAVVMANVTTMLTAYSEQPEPISDTLKVAAFAFRKRHGLGEPSAESVEDVVKAMAREIMEKI